MKVKNQVQIKNEKSRASESHVCTIGWNWLWQLTESSDNVRSRAVDRSTIQFLPVFWVLLTEACYYSKNLSSNQGVMNSFQYLQIINSNFLFSLSYFCMLRSTKSHWTYWLQIHSKLCFQRVALSGNYEIVAISIDKNTFCSDLDYKADIFIKVKNPPGVATVTK